MIYNKEISKDENDRIILEQEHNSVAARLFSASRIQEAFFNLSIIISNNDTDYDEIGNKITTGQSRIDVVYRLTETMSGHQKHLIRGNTLVNFGWDSLANKKLALDEFGLALQGGFSEALAVYAIISKEIESIENQMHLKHTEDLMHLKHTEDLKESCIFPDVQTIAEQIAIERPSAEASIPLDENEEDDDSSDTEESAHNEKEAHASSSEYSSAEYSMMRQQKIREWKQQIEEKRRKASEHWEIKKTAAHNRTLSFDLLSTSTQSSIREKWLPQAVQGRVNLAQFYDERIILLINDIKDGGNRGNPETLVSDSKYKGYMSRRITKGHRLVYKFDQTTKMLEVIECGGHYEKTKSSKG